MFVMGIDPGLSRCGYGVVESLRHGQYRLVTAGVISTLVSDPVPDRLGVLFSDIGALLDEFAPSEVAVERVLFQVNASTAMSVSQASGVVQACAVVHGAIVEEYSPNQVKLAIAGAGDADKVQVQEMVRRLCGLAKPPQPADAADAVAIALTHLAMRSTVGAMR